MNALTATRQKARYPTRAKIKAAVEIARELGLDVAGFEVSPDGSIRVLESRAAASPPPVSDFDRYKDQL